MTNTNTASKLETTGPLTYAIARMGGKYLVRTYQGGKCIGSAERDSHSQAWITVNVARTIGAVAL